jgi:hypothetical protein
VFGQAVRASALPQQCEVPERWVAVVLTMPRLMLKSAKRASLIENLRSLRGLGKMRVR